MTLEDRILALSNLSGPAGFEEAAAARVREMLSEVMDEVHTDVMGSVVALRRCGKEKAPRLLIDAHIDEIGFVVTGHEEGFLRFAAIGGVDARMLPAAEIRILTEPNIVGVVAATPPHVLEKDESNKAIKIENLFIDVGLTQEEAEKAIPVGTPAVYNAQARVFGEGQICGKALDDRACLAVILEALHRLKQAWAWTCTSSPAQEELGHGRETRPLTSLGLVHCADVDRQNPRQQAPQRASRGAAASSPWARI